MYNQDKNDSENENYQEKWVSERGSAGIQDGTHDSLSL